MNLPLSPLATLRYSLLLALVSGAFGLSACTTTDPSADTTIYPTPAEKNQEMQERMSQVTRSLM